jgi:hypothetical protein
MSHCPLLEQLLDFNHIAGPSKPDREWPKLLSKCKSKFGLHTFDVLSGSMDVRSEGVENCRIQNVYPGVLLCHTQPSPSAELSIRYDYGIR